MNYIRNFFLISTILFFFTSNVAFANDNLSKNLNDLINTNKLNNSSLISVSIRDLKTGNLIYQRNSTYLLHPASTLKAFTAPVVIKTLGEDYKIKTSLYRLKNNLYLKLSGDPLLTSSDLDKLLKSAQIERKKKINQVVIDDSIFDKIPYASGWMWDDANYSFMPKLSPYNLDHNTAIIEIKPENNNVEIKTDSDLKIINNLVIANNDDLNVDRDIYLNPDKVILSGKIKSSQSVAIPVNSPEKYFIFRLRGILKDNSIKFKSVVKSEVIPNDAVLLSEISHSIKDEISVMTHKSDNLVSESLLKIASATSFDSKGSTAKGICLINDFYKKINVDLSGIKIVDGSGLSLYNLLSADWMSLTLCKLYNFDNKISDLLSKSGEQGTLVNRLTSNNSEIHAKTGTLFGISALTGYLKSEHRAYAFAILIQNFTGNSASAKQLEDDIITQLSK